MATLAQHRRTHRKRKAGHNPLAAPLILLASAVVVAALYIGYVLWPRWPEAPVALNAPSLPIVVAGVNFNIEPAAIRRAIQLHPGAQSRVDLAYLWPALTPPDPQAAPHVDAPVDPNKRLFVTIAAGAGTLPIMARVKQVYPRYLVAEPVAGPPGLTLRRFRDGTPYEGEELAFEQANPAHFLARCTLKGAVNSGNCLLERRIGNADITFRFPRAWLKDWQIVAAGVDKLLARLHPSS
ncbi:MAG: hypothetical protein P8Y71_18715 [Pseudolabrys sp.]